MARETFLSRFRRQSPGTPPEGPSEPPQGDGSPEGTSEQPAAEAAPQLPVYHPGQLRRERRTLVRNREERIRDLGGLILEMFRRDRFREELVREQAEEVFGVEARIQQIDVLLMTSRQHVQPARCECGAPIVWGSHFCANCGRPTGEAVVTCTNCGHPLPADARFCGNCGTQAPAPAEAPREDADQSRGSEAAADPWER